MNTNFGLSDVKSEGGPIKHTGGAEKYTAWKEFKRRIINAWYALFPGRGW